MKLAASFKEVTGVHASVAESIAAAEKMEKQYGADAILAKSLADMKGNYGASASLAAEAVAAAEMAKNLGRGATLAGGVAAAAMAKGLGASAPFTYGVAADFAKHFGAAANAHMSFDGQTIANAMQEAEMRRVRDVVHGLDTVGQQAALLAEREKSREAMAHAMGIKSASEVLSDQIALNTPKELLERAMGSRSASQLLFEQTMGGKSARELLLEQAALREPLTGSDVISKVLSDSISAESIARGLVANDSYAATARGDVLARQDAAALAVKAFPEPVTLEIEAPVYRPHLVPRGPTLDEVFERSDEREQKRHDEQVALARRVVELAEENDRRSAENDRRAAENDRREVEQYEREQSFKRLTLRVSIILGVGAVLAGLWPIILTNIFG